ncbi:MAG: anaerobic ribonucleoside-triphosphate reductase activating protein [Patescibacteria group bacterium]
MKISGLHKTSLIDYPGHIAAIVFTQGCNFRCAYCHNSQLLNCQTEGSIKTREVFDFLANRRQKLNGLVITGGEPTLQPDLLDFIKQVKSLGYDIKLDTNGSHSSMLKEIIDQQLVDYIAMDIKAPLDKYAKIVGKKINTAEIKKSIDLIIDSHIDHEFRTTYTDKLLTIADIKEILKLITGAQKYYLQNYFDNDNVLTHHLDSSPIPITSRLELTQLFNGVLGVR